MIATLLAISSLVITGISFWFDWTSPGQTYWFPRAGALLVLAGAVGEYQKLMKTWAASKQTEQSVPSVKEKIAIGGIGMKELAEESYQTREFAIRIYDVLTRKDHLDVYSFILILLGTVIWAYGDVPFIYGWL